MADQNENQIAPIPKPPTAMQQALHVGKIGAAVLAALAATILGLEAQGIVLPPWLAAISKGILAIAVPLGIVSPGLGKKPDPDALK